MTFTLRENVHIAAPNPGLYAGVGAVMEYNGFIFNDRRLVDQIIIEKITGMGDPDVRDSREENPDEEGENPLDALYGGRTITLQGYIRTGSFNRREYLWDLLKDAFDELIEKPLIFRWLDFKETFADSQAIAVDWGYDVGSGTLTIASDGSGLAPTTTANKQIALAPSGSFSTPPAAGAKYSYGDAEHIVAAKHSIMTGVVFGPEFRRSASNQKLRVVYEHANTRVALYKVVGGTATLLDSTAITLTAGTTYYLVARAEDGVITYSVWASAPIDFGTPIFTKSFTLSGGDQAIFPSTNSGYRSGLYWTPNSTFDRIGLFDLGALNPGDAQISCRKFASIESDDEQVGWEYRRNFMISLRASDPKKVSRKLAVVSAVPSSFSLIFPGGGSGLTLPSDGSGLVFGASLGTATNLGRSRATPIVRMYGSMVNPALVNQRNNTRVVIEGTIPDNDYFEFDCYRRRVTDAAGVNRYGDISDLTNWIKLERGANPLIIGADSVGANGRVSLYYRHSSR